MSESYRAMSKMVYMRGIGIACKALLQATGWSKNEAAGRCGMQLAMWRRFESERDGWIHASSNDPRGEGQRIRCRTHHNFLKAFQDVYKFAMGKLPSIEID